MDEVAGRKVSTFNGPLEAGVRAVAILGAAYPKAFDVQRLTALDYLLVRTEGLGGPADLHPAAPIQTPATDVRTKVVQDSIHLMMTRDLIRREVFPDGIRYTAGEAAGPFLDSLRATYHQEVKRRAEWLVGVFGTYTDVEFHALMRRLFADWVEQFQTNEQSLGADI